MEKIRLVKTPTRVNGSFLPFGSVYGKVSLTFRRVHNTHDKNGRAVKSWRKYDRDITYYITDFKMCPCDKPAYYIHVWDNFHEVWYDTTTLKFPPELFRMIDDFIVEHDCISTTPFYGELRSVCPREKKPDKFNPAFSGYGYATNAHIMTDTDPMRRIRPCAKPPCERW